MRKLNHGNIFANLPGAKDKEIFQTLLARKNLKIERIISRGQTTGWLSDARDEWVIVLKGAGHLRFREGERLVKLKVGDYVYIPGNTEHRVEWTAVRKKTLWLAVKT